MINIIKNIPIRLDKESLVCYTKSVAGACVQAFGTFGIANQAFFVKPYRNIFYIIIYFIPFRLFFVFLFQSGTIHLHIHPRHTRNRLPHLCVFLPHTSQSARRPPEPCRRQKDIGAGLGCLQL